MKIKSIKLENHKVLGNLELNFTNNSGEAIDTIIFAGENGCGKSQILNVIFEFSQFQPKSDTSNEKREFIVSLTKEELKILEDKGMYKEFKNNLYNSNDLNITFDFSKKTWDQIQVEIGSINGISQTKQTKQTKIIDGVQFNDIKEIFKSILSDVAINFIPNNIQTVTSNNIDLERKISIKSSPNLATEITQLLIDVQALDDGEIGKYFRENGNITEEMKNKKLSELRMNRFTQAFNYMFPNKKYKRVDNISNFKKVIFEEFGKEIFLEDLSSGEKQIIFRGSFLLRDQKSNQGAIVLIDEPEISLHPNWQLNILEFYKKLFRDENSIQTSQLFVVTHSPFIIHNSNRTNDKVIVLKRDNSGNVITSTDEEFYGWTSSQTINKAFDINLFIDLDKPIVFVEGETDEPYIKKAIELFEPNLNIDIQWIGRYEGNNAKFTGDSALTQTKEFLYSNQNILKQKVILLYDCDTKVKNKDISDNIFIRKSPQQNNNIFEKGVENLIFIPNEEEFKKQRDKFYSKKLETDGYGAVKENEVFKKVGFCKYICEELPENSQKEYLKNFKDVIKIIKDIIE